MFVYVGGKFIDVSKWKLPVNCATGHHIMNVTDQYQDAQIRLNSGFFSADFIY